MAAVEDHVHRGRAAAVFTFDLATGAGPFLEGRRLLPGAAAAILAFTLALIQQ